MPGCKLRAKGVSGDAGDTQVIATMTASCSKYGFGLWHTIEASRWHAVPIASGGTPENKGHSVYVPHEPRETVATHH
jgi:hypothetical protein